MNYPNYYILFSGQGAQHTGMMHSLYEKYESCRSILQTAQDVLQRNIAELMFHGSQEELNMTTNTQPCMLAADLMAYTALMEKGIKPSAFAGFSLGEYAALVAAGVVSVRDAFRIVQERANAMQECAPSGSGGMAAVLGQDAETVSVLCSEANGYVVPVNYNCPGQIVISGEMNAIDSAIEIAKRKKIRIMKLPVSVPCHCRLMDDASEVLRQVFERTEFHEPFVPIFMNVDGKKETSIPKIKEKLVLQVKNPVYWQHTLENMDAEGSGTFIECGPGKTLTGFVKRTLPHADVFHVEDCESLEATVSGLAKE